MSLFSRVHSLIRFPLKNPARTVQDVNRQGLWRSKKNVTQLLIQSARRKGMCRWRRYHHQKLLHLVGSYMDGIYRAKCKWYKLVGRVGDIKFSISVTGFLVSHWFTHCQVIKEVTNSARYYIQRGLIAYSSLQRNIINWDVLSFKGAIWEVFSNMLTKCRFWLVNDECIKKVCYNAIGKLPWKQWESAKFGKQSGRQLVSFIRT